MVERKSERLPVSVSSAVYIEDNEGKLLLVKQAAIEKGGKWSPPGGGMHPHENPIDTALREVEEEIGVTINLVDLVGIYTVDRGNETSGIGFAFRGRVASNVFDIRKDEIVDYKYFTKDEVQKLIKQDMLYKPEYNKSVMEDWLNGNSYPLEVIKKLICVR